MIMDTKQKLALVFAHILGKEVEPEALEKAVDQLALDPKAQVALEQLETLFSTQDDPAWLEDVAASAEGVTTPATADFLSDQSALTRLTPDLVAHFEALKVELSENDVELLAETPTFIEQFRAQQKSQAREKKEHVQPDWHKAVGCLWRKVKETGEIIIQVISVPAQPATIPVRGHSSATENLGAFLRHFVIDPDETNDLSLEGTVRQRLDDPLLCKVLIQANIPSRWLDPAGIRVVATAGDWNAEGETDENGRIVFDNLPVNWLESLEVKKPPPDSYKL